MTSKNIGSENGRAKLTEQDVKEIIKLSSAGYYQKDLALRYNVARSTIAMILTGKSWTTITTERGE